MVAYLQDLKTIARSYGELRLQVTANLGRMKEYSTILFKAFLQYAEKKREEGLELSILLDEFFSEELALNQEEDKNTRLSLARRFCKLAKKHVRNPGEQTSILKYLEY